MATEGIRTGKFPQRRSSKSRPGEVNLAGLPPLENGDRLTRGEFERRYRARPDLKKVELIEGMVYMPSPVHFRKHAEPHSSVITWLGIYAANTPGVRLGDNATVRLDADNEVQPDALLRLDENRGGHSRIAPDDYLEGAPELIVEVATSSASYDLHDKMKVYRRNGVREYIVWQIYENRLEWFQLVEDEYQLASPDENGVIHSLVFPGLWLDVPALTGGDLSKALATLQSGLETEDHKILADKNLE